MDDFDPAKMQFDVVKLGDKVRNHTIGGFVENKFKYNRLEFIPGFRSDYLHRGNSYTLDPRGMISYAFPTETTLAAAGGMYSYFLQTSPFYFNDSPQLSKIDYIDPQKSYHSSGSVEQKYGSWTTKAEGFYNYFYNLVQIEHYTDSNGKARSYKNTAKIKSYGLELMQKLDLEENKPGFYGWVSYTLDQSKFRSGAKNDDPTKWNEWMDSWYEMVHIVKFVGAYTTNGHTFGTRFQFNTSAPYTPTVGGEQDITYVDPKDPNHQRWVPVSGERNSKRMEPDYRLDLRYSYRTNYEWGHTSWYIEVINATNHKSKYYEWDYRYGYSKSGKRKNPKLVTSDSAIAFIPNFGCEVKF